MADDPAGAPATPAAPDPSAPLPTVSRWRVALKLALVCLGLVLLVRWAAAALQAQGLGALHLAVWALVSGLVFNQLALLAAALRLRATLAAFGVAITVGQSFAIHLRSLFYFFFVPFSVGQELSRYLCIRKLDPVVSGKRLLIALLLDRVLGLVAALGAIAALAVFVLPTGFWQGWQPWWALLALLLLALGGALAAAHAPLRERLRELAQVAWSLSFRLLWPTLLSFVALALVCLSVYVIAVGAGWAVGLGQVTFALSTALLGMAVPLSLFGATLGELTGVGVLALLGIAPALAVVLISVAYVWRLFSAMQGALVEMWDHIRESRPAPIRQRAN